jgi:hypothetical protein
MNPEDVLGFRRSRKEAAGFHAYREQANQAKHKNHRHTMETP